jgi:hypothetical protein
MPDIFLGERRYIKNQVRVASDEFGESFGDRTPELRRPDCAQVSRKGHLPRARRRSPRRTEGGSDQLPASRLFIHNFDLLVGQLADETIYHQRCLAEASCQGRMHPVMPFIMACR